MGVAFLVGVLIGNVAFPSGEGCIADGTPEFHVTAQSWCNTGSFERVHISISDDAEKGFAYFTFNDDGLLAWKENQKPMLRVWGEMVNKALKVGVLMVIQIRYNGDILARCYNRKLKNQPGYYQTTCKTIENEEQV
jgi:hypothetical protein